MSNKIILVPLCIILLLCLSCDKDGDSISADIFPGQGLTEIKFTDTGADARSKLGSPASEASFSDTHQWSYFSTGISLIFEDVANSPDTETIDEIVVSSPYSGKTEEGIGIGSSKADVIAAYGEPVNEGFFGDSYDDPAIVVEYDEEQVSEIRLDK